MHEPEGLSGSAHTLSFVIPMWNEAEGADRAVRECLRVGDALVGSGDLAAFEVLAVDDGSTDDTAAVVATVGDDRVRVLRHGVNRGIGAALAAGFAASNGALVAYTDADLPVTMDDWSRALDLRRLTGAAVVAAFRVDGRGDGLRRRVYSAAWNGLVRCVLGLSVRDVNFAFKLFDGPTVRGLRLRSTSVCIDAEVLTRIHRRGGRIEQFGATYRTRESGESSLGSLRSIRATLVDLVRLRAELGRAA